MQTTNFTRISSKGQVVIPQQVRNDLGFKPGTPLSVVEQDNAVILRKIELPKVKSWTEVTQPFREAANKSGFTKEDLARLIKEVRATA